MAMFISQLKSLECAHAKASALQIVENDLSKTTIKHGSGAQCSFRHSRSEASFSECLPGIT